jgi:cephalosporin hydroxylase
LDFIVSIPNVGNPHTEAFREVAEGVHYSLLSLGHASRLISDLTPEQIGALPGRHILFGAHHWPVECTPPDGSILFNLERTDVDLHLGALMPRVTAWKHLIAIWDFSVRNMAFWEKAEISAVLCPIGYCPELERIEKIPESEKDIDVLFYGSLNPQRVAILDAISREGLRVESFQLPYGKERDKFIARSKIVLALHFYQPPLLEIVRVSYLLNNGAFVLSESCEDPNLPGVYYRSSDGIPETCRGLIWDLSSRKHIAECGAKAFKEETSMRRNVLYALEQFKPSALPARAALLVPLPAPRAAAAPSVVDAFHRHYYDSYAWADLVWRGCLVKKNPFDLQMYQEIIWECRPDVIIETGSAAGGSAVFFLDMLRLSNAPRPTVISIDVDHSPIDRRAMAQDILFWRGSSVDALMLEKVRDLLSTFIQPPKVMVVLDSDHSEGHVASELAAYAGLVTPGQYLVVEDTNINGHPVLPSFGPGPMEALEKWLPHHPEFKHDASRERLMVTSNPKGWLLKSPTLCLVVCGSSHEKIKAFLSRSPDAIYEVDDLRLIVTTDKRFGGLGSVGNAQLASTRCDVFGMCHADCVFEQGSLKAFAAAAAKVAVTGLVGRSLDGAYVWSKDRSEGPPAPVSTLNSCSVFFRKDSSLKFDPETFDSYHCIVEDLCCLAQSLGIPVIVPAAKANHLSDNWSNNHDAWMKQYWPYLQKLAEKWKDLPGGFQTT